MESYLTEPCSSGIEGAIGAAIATAIRPFDCGTIHAHGVANTWTSAVRTAARRFAAGKPRRLAVVHLMPMQSPNEAPYSRMLVEPYVAVEVPDNASSDIQLAYLCALLANPHDIDKTNTRVQAVLRGLHRMHFYSGQVKLVVELAGARVCADGASMRGGSSLQLPGGEVFLELDAGSCEGVALVEWIDRGLPVPIAISVSRGVIVAVHSEITSARQQLMGTCVTELGIGTNPFAVSLSSGCLFEKVRGAFHLGFEGAMGEHGDLPLLMKCDHFDAVF